MNDWFINACSNITYGAFAGIFTAFFLWIIKIVYERLVPYVEKLTYKGLNISGHWQEEHNVKKSGLIQSSSITLKQNAYKISGKIILIKNIDEKLVNTKEFNIEGFLYNGFLNLICQNSNDTMLGVHNYLLQVKSDGRNLEGFKTYYEIFNEELLSEKISWVKEDKNNLEILNR